MGKKERFLFLLSLVLILSTWTTAQASEEREEKALQAVRQWLDLVDNDRFGESWITAATFFKSAVGKEQWELSLSSVRKPLGKVISRKLKSKQYTKKLPGAPDGEYVVIQFETSFEHKGSAVETVTPMMERNGTWRVSGYYIK